MQTVRTPDDAPLRAKVPGAAGQPHVTVEGASHFLQEDRGPGSLRHEPLPPKLASLAGSSGR